MTKKHDELGLARRVFLTCMAWVGTGAMWSLTRGVLKGLPVEQAARGDMGHGSGTGGEPRFVQSSHNHVGLDRTDQKCMFPVLDTDKQFDRPGRGGVNVMRRSYTRYFGTLAVAAALMANRPAMAAQSVHELHVIASHYQFTPSTIHVTAGEPVRLVLSSMDTVHGFSIPKLKIDTQIPKGGDPVIVEFVAPAAGRYEIACSEFCGIGHAQMKATLVSTLTTQLSR